VRFLVTLIASMLACCLLAQAPSPLKIGVGDRLLVTVVGYKEYSGTYEVVSDGSISGPGFGVVVVAGETLNQITTVLTAKLRDSVNDPRVYVSLESERPKVIFVIGIPIGLSTASAPVRPGDSARVPQGQVPLVPETTVRSVLAGTSLGDRPDLLEAVLVRDGVTFKLIDVDKLLKGDPNEFDGPLMPNDVLIVRPKPVVKVWLVGGFRAPGDHLVPAGITVDQAISLLGGYDPTSVAGGSPDAQTSFINRAKVELRRGDEVKTLSAISGAPDRQQTIEPGDVFTLVLPKSVNITVAGYVQHSGEVFVDSSAGVLAAVAKAGGPTPNGGLNGVLVFRGNEVYRLDLGPQAFGKKPLQFELHGDDLVYVPENRNSIQVLGTVLKSGVQYLPLDGRPYRLSEALANAGGLIETVGTLRRVAVERPDGTGKYKSTLYNLDEFLKDGKASANPVLQPGDVLYFGTPKGFSVNGLIQVLSIAALLNSLRGI
jgi:protein involved in polysaccharide export with SLBB domain